MVARRGGAGIGAPEYCAGKSFIATKVYSLEDDQSVLKVSEGGAWPS